jgi:hypothetical protein
VRDGDASPRLIEGRIETLRHELGNLVSELDRRRHEAFDLRLQASRHPVALAVAGVAVAAVVGMGIAAIAWRRGQREKPLEKARRAGRAFGRLMSDPEHLAREPGVGEKILAAAGAAAASLLVKRVLEQMVPPPPRKAPA